MIKITTPSIILSVASPNSGKTQFVKQIIRQLLLDKELQYGFIFCNDFDDYLGYFNEHFIFDYNNFDEKISEIIEFKNEYKDSKIFIILDDFISKININNKLLNHLFSTYRHLNISLFLCFQHINKINRLHRNCSNYLFLGKMNSLDSINCCYDIICGFYSKKNDLFKDIQNLKQYEFLVFDLKKNNKIKYKFNKLNNFYFDFKSIYQIKK